MSKESDSLINYILANFLLWSDQDGQFQLAGEHTEALAITSISVEVLLSGLYTRIRQARSDEALTQRNRKEAEYK